MHAPKTHRLTTPKPLQKTLSSLTPSPSPKITSSSPSTSYISNGTSCCPSIAKDANLRCSSTTRSLQRSLQPSNQRIKLHQEESQYLLVADDVREHSMYTIRQEDSYQCYDDQVIWDNIEKFSTIKHNSQVGKVEIFSLNGQLEDRQGSSLAIHEPSEDADTHRIECWDSKISIKTSCDDQVQEDHWMELTASQKALNLQIVDIQAVCHSKKTLRNMDITYTCSDNKFKQIRQILSKFGIKIIPFTPKNMNHQTKENIVDNNIQKQQNVDPVQSRENIKGKKIQGNNFVREQTENNEYSNDNKQNMNRMNRIKIVNCTNGKQNGDKDVVKNIKKIKVSIVSNSNLMH